MNRPQPKKSKIPIFLLVIVGLIAASMFLAGSAYQSSIDNTTLLTPSVNAVNTNPNIQTITAIYPTLVNVTLILSSHSIAHATGTLHLQLGPHSTGWNDTRSYDVQPGDHQAFQFYPPQPVSAYDSVTVTT